MTPQSLLWRYFPSFVLLLLGSALSYAWFLDSSLASFFEKERERELLVRTQLPLTQYSVLPEPLPAEAMLAQLKQWGQWSGLHVSLLNSQTGELLADSHGVSQTGALINFPELQAALAGNPQTFQRFNPVFGETALWLAKMVPTGGGPPLLLRTSLPLSLPGTSLNDLRLQLLVGLIGLIALSMMVSLLITDRFRMSLIELREGAERFARGELQRKLRIPDSTEVGALAQTLNNMALQLNVRIQSMVQQRSEREAILSSMEEGFLAVDKFHRLLNLNRAAARLFRLQREQVLGQDLQLVIRNFHLSHFVHEALTQEQPLERDLMLRDSDDRERYFQAHITPLRDVTGHQIGALIVLNDVTRIKHLETIRRDFVANVSHELKTPITSIKGAVETLIDGAIEQPEVADRFLNIISRHSDRLDTLISDLLLLSQLEYHEQANLQCDQGPLLPVLRQAVGVCELKAREKEIQLHWECPEGLMLWMNAPLLEQALVNLIDNAIKYSEPQRWVKIRAFEERTKIVIEVIDQGCGIEGRHLDRLFERFYRVDAARSRKLGGTGLGLAIVKHVTQSQRGSIEVQSTPNKGSRFVMKFPPPPVEFESERSQPETWTPKETLSGAGARLEGAAPGLPQRSS